MSASTPALQSVPDVEIVAVRNLYPKTVYTIRYSSVPKSKEIGYAQVQTGNGLGATNDPALVELVEGFKDTYHLHGIQWKATKYQVMVKTDKRLKSMDAENKDDGPVELKNGNWATFYAYNAIMHMRDWIAEQEKLDEELVVIQERKLKERYGAWYVEAVKKQQDEKKEQDEAVEQERSSDRSSHTLC